MSFYFEGFYERAAKIRLVKSSLAAAAAGTLTIGVLILLWKLELISLLPIFSVLIGIAAAILVGGGFYLLLAVRDSDLAARLDTDFSLSERVRTMLAFRESNERIHILQRRDTEAQLEKIPTAMLGARRLWIYLLSVLLGAAMLIVGIAVPDGRTIVREEPIVPFELSAAQEAGINELISYVSASDAKEPYKSDIIDELKTLLSVLKMTRTEADMKAAVSESLAAISEITYDSSSMTEILNALWITGSDRVRALVRALDTTALSEPDWGAFADGYSEFKTIMTEPVSPDTKSGASSDDGDDGHAYLEWVLDDLVLKVNTSLVASGIKAGDPLYDALSKLIGSGKISTDAKARGFAAILADIDGMDYDTAKAEAVATIEAMSEIIYAASAEIKINANTGEYVQRKLSVLFGAKLPQFERPSLKDSSESSGNDQEGGTIGGGVGEGVQFGSDDLVLDPITGKYVKYSELYSKYNALMIERLSDEKYNYTDEQKKAIEKYFALLYSGLKDDK